MLHLPEGSAAYLSARCVWCRIDVEEAIVSVILGLLVR
jgi:hypothetical protein